jgi:hypothetical protein
MQSRIKLYPISDDFSATLDFVYKTSIVLAPIFSCLALFAHPDPIQGSEIKTTRAQDDLRIKCKTHKTHKRPHTYVSSQSQRIQLRVYSNNL